MRVNVVNKAVTTIVPYLRQRTGRAVCQRTKTEVWEEGGNSGQEGVEGDGPTLAKPLPTSTRLSSDREFRGRHRVVRLNWICVTPRLHSLWGFGLSSQDSSTGTVIYSICTFPNFEQVSLEPSEVMVSRSHWGYLLPLKCTSLGVGAVARRNIWDQGNQWFLSHEKRLHYERIVVDRTCPQQRRQRDLHPQPSRKRVDETSDQFVAPAAWGEEPTDPRYGGTYSKGLVTSAIVVATGNIFCDVRKTGFLQRVQKFKRVDHSKLH